jgi:hypothetical protein
MTTVDYFGPYVQVRTPEDPFQPGQLLTQTFGPYTRFWDAVVTVAVRPDAGFASHTSIRLESISHRTSPVADGEALYFIDCDYRNTSSEPLTAWFVYLCVVTR